MTAATAINARRRDARRRSVRPGAGRIAVAMLLTWAMVGMASVAWWPIYAASPMIVAGTGALMLGAAVATTGALFRLGAGPVALLTAVAFAGGGVPLAIPGSADGALPTVPGLTALFGAVALSWKQLLTVALPVGSYQSLLVPYFLLALVATVIGMSIAARSSRAEVATIPPLGLFVIGVAFGATRLDFPLLSGVALVGFALIWALGARHLRRARMVASTVGSRLRPGRSVVRPTVIGAATIAIAAAVAFAATTVAPIGPTRQVLRSVVVKHFDPQKYNSPLAGLRAYEEQPAVDAPQLRVSGLPTAGFIRIATLDTYDGVVYSVGGPTGSAASGSFERIPTAVDVRGVTGTPATIAVAVSGYRGVWLPTVGDLESVDFTGRRSAADAGNFFYNPTTETAALLGGVSPTTSYRMRVIIPDAPGASAIATARPGAARVPPPTNVPAAVATTVASVTKGAATPGAKLEAVVQWLRTTGYVSHGVGTDRPSASGHGANRIQQLLTAVPMVGDAEQYAVAASLMAQNLGFPARVVMGFAPQAAGSGGTVTVTGSDITARIEVDTREYGWVMIDPNPPVRPIPAEQQQAPKPITRPETIVPPPPQQQSHQNTQNPDSTNRKSPPTEPAWLLILRAILPWAIGFLALLAALATPFIVILAVKAGRRRRRRRSPTGRERIVGAWDEYRDRLLDSGYTVPSVATRREVAAATRGPRASGLAALADRAVFGPSEVDAMTADRMWAETDRAIGELTTDRGRWERLRMRVSMRSLRPRSVPRPGTARRGGYDVPGTRA